MVAENNITVKVEPLGLDFDSIQNMSKPEIRSLITKIEEFIKTGTEIEIPVSHHFSKSVYGREMVVPSGCLLVGKIHKYQNMNILSKGEATILSIDGVVRVKAPYTFVSDAGAKRVIYAHDDVVWTTIIGTDETDVDKIEELFIAKSYDELSELEGSIVIDVKEELWLS